MAFSHQDRLKVAFAKSGWLKVAISQLKVAFSHQDRLKVAFSHLDRPELSDTDEESP